MKLRPATMRDALPVLAWRNDPHTRAMSLESGAVAEADHLAWFERALGDADRILLIGEMDGAPAGMARFDRRASGWEVSINVAPEARGKGAGRALLLGALDRFDGAHPGHAVDAVVRSGNTASVRLFEAAGFNRCEDRDGLLRYRRPPA